MNLSIIGCGWYGTALAQELKTDYDILGTTRSLEKLSLLQNQGIAAEILTSSMKPSTRLMNAQTMILNIPPFPDFVDWIQKWDWRHQTHLIFISSTSVYGFTKDVVDENSTPHPDTESGHIIYEAEKWVQKLPHYSIIRFGGLIGKNRHPGKHLSGKSDLPQGHRPVNLIHLDDCIGFTKFLIQQGPSQEIYNLVHPLHPTREKYYSDYCIGHQLPLPKYVPDNLSYGHVTSSKVQKLYQFKKEI